MRETYSKRLKLKVMFSTRGNAFQVMKSKKLKEKLLCTNLAQDSFSVVDSDCLFGSESH